MIFIDANIFLAYDNADDVHHEKAVKVWNEIEAGKFGQHLTSDYAFNEAVGVTLRKKGKERALLLGDQIRKSVFMLNIDRHMLEEAWRLFRKTEFKLNLVDCTNIVVSELADAEFIATFDSEFKKTELKVIS